MLATPKQIERIKRRLYWTSVQIGPELNKRVRELLPKLDRTDASAIIEALDAMTYPGNLASYEDTCDSSKRIIEHTLKNYT